ncbi:thymidylate synthase [Agromyces mediolanus]|uniref:thymidylate synthase n=1 Tax=Microbacteriaceae TaxID=85023 RepID=UPI00158C5622|nr:MULTISPECIES: thymidylate synthase [Microbacteriaceae]MCM3658467.1 thymidylate synthase [Agromyces mediolanus]
MTIYKDAQTAFMEELRCIIDAGETIEVRGETTRELRARLIEISNVRARHVIVPHRHNNVFASIAESMWVIYGRNDLDYLGAYLRRASDFSDDGVTWRAGYGPRLRDWNGVDQLSEVVKILRSDPSSRRAVISIYDPDRDFVASRDIPCNNWLHFIVRDGHLDLHVAARSTDIWWGFSGINTFEWTLLLEMMARWLGHDPGRLVFFSSSLHLYERHFDKASQVVLAPPSSGELPNDESQARFDTDWERSSGEFEEWMRLEAQLRSGHELKQLECRLTDPLLIAYVRMIDVFWVAKRGADPDLLNQLIREVGDSGLTAAATEYFGRRHHQQH